LQTRAYGSLENPSTPFSAVFQWLDAMGGGPTAAGKIVSTDTAMRLSAVFRAVDLIAGTVAKAELLTYRQDGEAKLMAKDHYLWRLLKDRANPEMSAFRFKRLMMSWVLLHGNAYAVMDVSNNGRVLALQPVHPGRVQFTLGQGYMVRPLNGQGSPLAVPSGFMLHLRGLETDEKGIGLSVIGQARESLGITMAAEEQAGRLFSNGMQFGGFIKVPQQLSDATKDKIVRYLEKRHLGSENAHRIGVIDEGMEFIQTTMAPEDAQFLETRKAQVTDIARWFGVPPHKIGDLDKSTNNNIEHQGLEFVNDCIDPHLCNWENEINNSLLSEQESRTFFCQFNRRNLVPRDAKTKAEAAAIYRGNGILDDSEIREDLGMNPHPEGGVLMANGTFRPVKVLAAAPLSEAPTPPASSNTQGDNNA
jgi:HK97 family phage portal protein